MSTSNEFISCLSNPNEEIFKPRLHPHKFSFQCNKRCANIPSNEKVMIILLKHILSVENVRSTEVATEI